MKDKVETFLKFVREQKQHFEKYVDVFHIAEKNGFHILESGFYSPIPIVKDIPEKVFTDEISTIKWNEEYQIKLLNELKEFGSEFQDIIDSKKFNNANLSFGWHDAPVYYSMIRHFKPKRILEVGGGNSTKISYLASLKNDSTKIDVIDPFLNEEFKNELFSKLNIIEKPVQEIPISFFKNLEKNDILFIDSTHVSKAGSDVNYLYLEVLPELNSGVLIHIHDIFLPKSYPKEWMRDKLIFWNEQYLLHAFLIGNKNFEIILANAFLQKNHSELLKRIYNSEPAGGVSFWMRKIE